jgi:molybdate transport repressor ModE-like protein
MRFDLTDLRLFAAVADAGSITHGAAEVGLSLPAASERLRDMEKVGQVSLLRRGRRGVALTEAGEMLAHHARKILHQMALMNGEISQHAKGLRASIRIFANTAAVAEFLPSRLASWLAAYPQVDVELRERESLEIAKSIAEGIAEIGILAAAVATDALTLRPFATDRLVMVSSKQHPLAQQAQVRFVDVVGYPFISLTRSALQNHLDAQAAKLGVTLKTRIQLPNFDGICRMAGSGAGIGIIPESAARRSKRSTQIVTTRIQDDWATRHLALCVRDENELTPPAKALFNHLANDR